MTKSAKSTHAPSTRSTLPPQMRGSAFEHYHPAAKCETRDSDIENELPSPPLPFPEPTSFYRVSEMTRANTNVPRYHSIQFPSNKGIDLIGAGTTVVSTKDDIEKTKTRFLQYLGPQSTESATAVEAFSRALIAEGTAVGNSPDEFGSSHHVIENLWHKAATEEPQFLNHKDEHITYSGFGTRHTFGQSTGSAMPPPPFGPAFNPSAHLSNYEGKDTPSSLNEGQPRADYTDYSTRSDAFNSKASKAKRPEAFEDGEGTDAELAADFAKLAKRSQSINATKTSKASKASKTSKKAVNSVDVENTGSQNYMTKYGDPFSENSERHSPSYPSAELKTKKSKKKAGSEMDSRLSVIEEILKQLQRSMETQPGNVTAHSGEGPYADRGPYHNASQRPSSYAQSGHPACAPSSFSHGGVPWAQPV